MRLAFASKVSTKPFCQFKSLSQPQTNQVIFVVQVREEVWVMTLPHEDVEERV